jgi:putative acyl-CoA dehydrogenase
VSSRGPAEGTMTFPRPHVTHEVRNQVPLLAGHDVADDPALVAAVGAEGAGWVAAELHDLGRLAGSAGVAEQARLANEHVPVLRSHDRFGHRIDEVEFHPAWHALMTTAISHGLHAAPWAEAEPGAHVARAAKFYVWSQAEAGHGCPVSMTYAAVPTLRHAPELARQFEPLLAARRYDPGLRPPAGKAGLLAGMAMTEKQGGSDVRANTTRAEPAPGLGAGAHVLTGHKWFCSAPMSDLFLTLAQGPGGLTCFLLPRVLPSGERNALRIERLKDKLGNRSNASAEVEFDTAVAWQVGEPGRGVATIIEMVSATRLDCVIGSAAGMRAATVAAVHHASHRQAFGKNLIAQPLMASVLADLALEAEAATMIALRLAGAADRAARGDQAEAALLRLALPAAKFWVCKRFPAHAAEALECLGGNGYVEESGLPRLYREAPLNSIWEGSGNVTALDVLRALDRAPAAADALTSELEQAAGASRTLDQAAAAVRHLVAAPPALASPDAQHQARRLAGLIAVTLQAALLARRAPAEVADVFCATRLGEAGPAGAGSGDGYGHPGAGWPGVPGGPAAPFGILPGWADTAAILDRARARIPG